LSSPEPFAMASSRAESQLVNWTNSLGGTVAPSALLADRLEDLFDGVAICEISAHLLAKVRLRASRELQLRTQKGTGRDDTQVAGRIGALRHASEALHSQVEHNVYSAACAMSNLEAAGRAAKLLPLDHAIYDSGGNDGEKAAGIIADNQEYWEAKLTSKDSRTIAVALLQHYKTLLEMLEEAQDDRKKPIPERMLAGATTKGKAQNVPGTANNARNGAARAATEATSKRPQQDAGRSSRSSVSTSISPPPPPSRFQSTPGVSATPTLGSGRDARAKRSTGRSGNQSVQSKPGSTATHQDLSNRPGWNISVAVEGQAKEGNGKRQ